MSNSALSLTTTAPEATPSSKGIVQLTGDLAGTASYPTVPGLASKVSADSPQLTGVPLAPTAIYSDNSNQISTTAFVQKRLTEYTVGLTDGDFPVSSYPTISHAVNAALLVGNVFIKPGLYTIPATGSTVINPINNRKVRGAGIGLTTIQTARPDYVFKNGSTTALNDFSVEDISFDCQNLSIVNVAKFYKSTRVGMRRCEFKNSSQWFVVFGNEPSASSTDMNYDCYVENCIFDTHSSVYEMLLIYNSVNTKIYNCIFRNNVANSPTVGIWQLCNETLIQGCEFYNCLKAPIYYSNTTDNITVRDCYFENCGSTIIGGNASDNGLLGRTYAFNIRILDSTFIGGSNSVTATAIQFGAVDGCYAHGNYIEGYESGIKYGNGNTVGSTTVPYPSINGYATNNIFKNINTAGTSYGIHNALIFNQGAGSGMLIANNRVIDTQATKTLKYAISFNTTGSTYDNIRIYDNDLGVGVTGGSSIILNNSVTLGANTLIYQNANYTGTAPKQSHSTTSSGIDASNNKIVNLATPTLTGDAVNKSYVDSLLSSSGASDATTSSKGIIQLTNDLSGTASLPTVKNLDRIYNVKDYGAKGDSLTFADGSITAAQKTLNSVSATFTSNDVGKVITILGAGAKNTSGSGSGAPGVYTLITTITGFTDANNITISTAATTTVTAATFTYGTNDQPSIQAAIDACTLAGGGDVVVPPGRYRGLSGNSISVKQNVNLRGQGNGASIILMGVSFSTGVSGAAAPLIKNAHMKDFTIDGIAMNGNHSGLGYTYVQDCTVDGVTVVNVPFWSIIGGFSSGLPNSPSLYIRNSVFDRGIYFNNPMLQDMTAFNFNSYVRMENVEFRNNGNGYATLLFYNWQDIVDIRDIRFVNCKDSDTTMNVNGNHVSIKGMHSDGGTSQIYGQNLTFEDVTEDIALTTTSGCTYKVRAGRGYVSGVLAGQRWGASGVSNGSTVITYDAYKTFNLANAGYTANAVAAGDTTITFPNVVPGYYNGEQITIGTGTSTETATILSGAGTTTWTLAASLTYAHANGFFIQGIVESNITITKSRIAVLRQNLEGLKATCTLKVTDSTISSGKDTFGFIGFGGTNTTATTVSLSFENVSTCGGISFSYFGPSTAINTYSGHFKNVLVYNSATQGYPAPGQLQLSQNISLRFINCEIYGSITSATLAPVFDVTKTIFRGMKNSQTGAPLVLPDAVGVTPAVPASGTALTNKTMTDVLVYVSGGTVSQVKIGSISTNISSTPFVYKLSVGQTITLTYTSAPTWVWVGDN